MEGPDDVSSGEALDWAVRTALAAVDEAGEPLYGRTAEAYVEDAFDFIAESLEERGWPPPDRSRLIAAVRAEQHHRALEWIHDHFLEGGLKLVGDALTDAQWDGISGTMRAVGVEPPSRATIDATIRERWR